MENPEIITLRAWRGRAYPSVWVTIVSPNGTIRTRPLMPWRRPVLVRPGSTITITDFRHVTTTMTVEIAKEEP